MHGNTKYFEYLDGLYESGEELVRMIDLVHKEFDITYTDAVGAVGAWMNSEKMRAVFKEREAV